MTDNGNGTNLQWKPQNHKKVTTFPGFSWSIYVVLNKINHYIHKEMHNFFYSLEKLSQLKRNCKKLEKSQHFATLNHTLILSFLLYVLVFIHFVFIGAI